MKKIASAAAFAAALTLAFPASAHMGLAVEGAGAAGTTNLFGFGAGHGCGTSPTTAVRIQIPAGITSVRPVAKPGWEITITTNADGGVTQIDFTGGNLPNEWYDQFWIRARIDAAVATGTNIHFPVIQECVEGANNWIAIPVEGQPEPAEPAPGFTVHAPVEAAGH
jgi:uncharacterized protein YcnI